MCDSPNQHQHSDAASWAKLQPILEKYILRGNIAGMDRGLDLLLSWFEVISKSSDKINTFKSIVGLSPDMAEERKQTRLSYSTSSISDLIERDEGEKKRVMNDDDTCDYRNKRMKVSRLLCNEDLDKMDSIKSDDENSDAQDYEEENSCPDSFDSNSPEDDFGSDGGDQSLHIIEDDAAAHNNARRRADLIHLHNQQQQQQHIADKNIQMQQQPQPTGKAGASGSNSQQSGSLAPSPKQLMIIREKMLEYVTKNPSASRPSCISIVQQPASKVVWKNRRLDTPFKLKLDGKTAAAMAGANMSPSNIVTLGIVTDHKGKLQIDSVENFTEAFNAQGIAVFQGLKMTKGTWGKEWSLTFIALARPTNGSYNNAVVLSVSQPFAIVVKTRKNPQIRHNYGSGGASAHNSQVLNSASENSSSSPEASPTMAPRRGRLPASAPLMSLQSRNAAYPFANGENRQIRFPQDDMASLLWAAEIKQREHTDPEPELIQRDGPQRGGSDPRDLTSPKPKYSSMILSPPKQTAVSTR
eukprot:gene5257-6085_t